MVDEDIREFLVQKGLHFDSLIVKTKNSTVIKVKDQNSNYLAVKIIDKDCFKNIELKFYNERKFKGVIKLKGHFENPKKVFLVFKFYKNNLKIGIGSNPSLPTKKRWAKQLLNILFKFEEANIYHRDIKPENILLKGSSIESSDILLCDMGSITENIELSKSGYLTPGYEPPELNEEQKNTKKSDIWSFGQVILEIFTKKKLNPKATVEENFKILRILCENDDLCNLLIRCFDSGDKRASFADLINAPFFSNTVSLDNGNLFFKAKSKLKSAVKVLYLLNYSKPTTLKKIWINSLHSQVLPCVKSYFRQAFENLRKEVSNQIDSDILKQIDIKILQCALKQNEFIDIQSLENLIELYEECEFCDKNDRVLKKSLNSVLKYLKTSI